MHKTGSLTKHSLGDRNVLGILDAHVYLPKGSSRYHPAILQRLLLLAVDPDVYAQRQIRRLDPQHGMVRFNPGEGSHVAIELFEVLHAPRRRNHHGIRQEPVEDGCDHIRRPQIAVRVHELLLLVEVTPHEVVAEPLALERKVDRGDVDSAVEVGLTSALHLLAAINSYTETTIH